VTRYAAKPYRELVKEEPSAIGLLAVELERLRAESRALRRVYLGAPPLDLVRANEARQRALRSRISAMLAATAVPAIGQRARFAGGGMRPGWDLQW
jgi:hypothetical protein